MSKPLWSVDQIVGQLTNWGAAWDNDAPIAYTFYENLAPHLGVPPNFSPFTFAQRQAVARVLEVISDVANLDFVYVPDNGQAPGQFNQRFGLFNVNAQSVPFWGAATNYDVQSADIPYGEIYGADIIVNGFRAIPQGNWNIGDSNPRKLMHELLHVMGLDHAGNYNGDSANYENDALFLQDSNQYTVMSYWAAAASGADHVVNGVTRFAATPLLFDVASLQKLYGANMSTRTGDTVYGFNSTAGRLEFDFNMNWSPIITIWDAGGKDRLDFSGFAEDTVIDLNAGAFSDAAGMTKNISIAFGAIIEDAVGGLGNDTVIGNEVANFISLQVGGNDTASGGAGADIFYYGSAFGLGDANDGGLDVDVLALQGNYSLSLDSDSLINIESLSLISGGDSRFGQAGNTTYDYVLSFVDANVAADARFIVNAALLTAGEDFTFNGSAETDGRFLIYAGQGLDNLTGGSLVDWFFFGEAGRFAAGDRVDGGGGADNVIIRGNYTGANAVVFAADAFANVETLTLMTGTDLRFAAGGVNYAYDVRTHDGNVVAGQTFTVNGAQLTATEVMTFNGSAELDGHFRIFGSAGVDFIFAGQGNDLIYGGRGKDELTGNGGNDIFRFDDIWSEVESAVGNADKILDFVSGQDVIDLSLMDADSIQGGEQDFLFKSDGLFTGAGQLRAVASGSGTWFVEGDVNGDGVADFQIEVTAPAPLVAADFIL